MRISDWSSDVCSSDLGTIKNTIKADGMLMVPAGSAWIPFSDSHRKNGGKPAACWTFPDVAGKVTSAQKRTRTSTTFRPPAPEADRKRAAAGKRVSVRLDLDGLGIIKNIKQNNRRK